MGNKCAKCHGGDTHPPSVCQCNPTPCSAMIPNDTHPCVKCNAIIILRSKSLEDNIQIGIWSIVRMFGCEQKLPLKTQKKRNRPGTHECFVCLSLLHLVHLMSCWWCNAYQALNTIGGSLLYIENNAVYWDPPEVCNGPQVTAVRMDHASADHCIRVCISMHWCAEQVCSLVQ